MLVRHAVIPRRWNSACARRTPAPHSSECRGGGRAPAPSRAHGASSAVRRPRRARFARRTGPGSPCDPRERESLAVDPGAVAVPVVEEGGPVGQDRVEIGTARRPVLEGVDRPAGAHDPLELGVLRRVGGDRLETGLARVGVVEHAPDSSTPPPRDGSARPGNLEDRAALELEHPRGRRDVLGSVCGGADPGDRAVADGDRLGDRPGRVGREDVPPVRTRSTLATP